MEQEKQYDKLLAHPVEIEIKAGEQLTKAWLHALTDIQTIHCLSVYGEQKQILMDDGQDEPRAKEMALLALDIQTMLHSVRVGPEKNSPKLFHRATELLYLKTEERNRMSAIYAEHFDMTEADLGNSLRARTDISLTRSNLPASSQVN